MKCNKMDASKSSLPVNDVLRKGRRRVKLLFYVKGFGILLTIAAVAALQALQTSINIKDNAGAIALTAGYITSIIFGLFFCPALIRVFGARMALVVGDVCYLIYCLANFYPEVGVLTAGGSISGIARAFYFPAYTLLVFEVSKQCMDFAIDKPDGYYLNYFQSRFYTMVESASIVGNLLSYAILYGASSSDGQQDNPMSYTTVEPNTTYIGTENLYQYCGVHDCQDPDVVNQSIDQYVPPDKSSVYIFISVVSLLVLIGTFLHSFIYPGLGSFGNKLEKLKQNIATEVSDSNKTVNSDYVVDSISVGSLHTNENNGAFTNGGFATEENYDNNFNQVKIHSTNTQSKIDYKLPERGNEDESIDKDGREYNYWTTLKATLSFLVYPRSLLLGITGLHFGMTLGFAYADLTRAYASCMVGVEKTGLFASLFGVAGMISAYLYGKLTFPNRRLILYAVCNALELAMYASCYFWNPDPDTMWVVYLTFVSFGIVKGLFRQNMVETYALHFPNNKDVALSIYNVWFTAGMGLQYGFSTFMCVETKIYTLFGVFIIALVLFVVAEISRMRESDRNEPNIQEASNTRL